MTRKGEYSKYAREALIWAYAGMKVGDDRMVESGIALVEHIERMQRYLGGGLRARQLRIRLARRWPKAARAADKRKLTAFVDKCIRLIARYEEMRERESE